MHTKLYSATTIGIQAQLIEVEVDLSMGLAQFTIVGLADKAINESKERVRAAIKNSGCSMPIRAITVNLAPANIRKQDVLFDVPIALALLIGSQTVSVLSRFIEETVFIGELALSGAIRPVCGVLPIADHVREAGKKRLVVPRENAHEAALIEGIEVIGVASLEELLSYVNGETSCAPTPSQFAQSVHVMSQHLAQEDMADVVGQVQAKRAILLAAAGHHNIIMVGPPGSGKTMLARRLRTLLAPLSFQEIIEVTKVYSISGQLRGRPLIIERPFRAPHHTISSAGLIGGGSTPRPGEVSLAHHGVLFLDELTEFSRATLEVLRQPLESGDVRIARALQSVVFPAQFLLVAALNPCMCGYYGQKNRCQCTPQQIKAYGAKISGPLLDRIDLQVTLRAVAYQELGERRTSLAKEQSSEEIRGIVARAHALQKMRGQTVCNGQLQGAEVATFCQLTASAAERVSTYFDRLGLSMRGYHKVLKVARTIADVAESEIIDAVHIQEALSLRLVER